jgi:adenosylmethionine-8-amino-7-oxononanoate aminotransferase
MTHIFHRMPQQTYPRAVSGEGPYLIDSEGRRYLDASGGAAVSCLGHSDDRVIAAIKRQLETLPFAHTAFFTTEAAENLADFLAERAPEGLDHVYFLSGGSEAIEAALKLARQYFVEIGQPERHRFIARRQSYHGNTLGALSVGGNLGRRTLYAPLLMEVSHVSPCYAYRERADHETDAAYVDRLGAELEAEIARHGAETIIAFVAETVVGATLGAVAPVPGYLQRMRKICDRHGILLILDEVMCGMGRTGTLFACEQDGVSPDIVAIAKALGAGYQPIGAMIASRKVYDAVVDGSGFFHHGHTYLGHAAACAGALAVQTVIEEDGLLERVRVLGGQLVSRLTSTFGQHEHVGDIRGRGLFLGLEFVADRATRRPFDPSARLNTRLKANAMAEGLVCYPSGGTSDGKAGDHVLLAPPYILTEPQLDELVEKLDRALRRTLDDIAAASSSH